MHSDRDLLIDLIKRLTDRPLPDREHDELAAEVRRLSPDPEWSDYIYYSDGYEGVDGRLDVEALVDKILSYKPILL